MDVNVFGSSGYAGGQLLKILAKHPEFNLKHAFANSKAGTKISNEHPFLTGVYDKNFETYQESKIGKDDVLLFALPHGESGDLAKKHSENQIVDLGADFRLKKSDNWNKYYKGEFAGTWTYGLPELKGQREVIGTSRHVANPGCYATVINLSLAPFIHNQIIDLNLISVVATSGTTGAGKKVNEKLLASEVMESITNYKMEGQHQHIAEIQETLSNITNQDVKISFNPTLGPFPRGILANTIFKAINKIDKQELINIFEEYYKNNNFIHLINDRNVTTSEVQDTNNANFNIFLDQNTQQITIVGVIDNLIKGAAGQAIQNLNIMNGFEEKLGLSL